MKKSVTLIITGSESGSTIRTSVRSGPQPSMIAASISPSGMLSK